MFYWLYLINEFGSHEQKLNAVLETTRFLQVNLSELKNRKEWKIRNIYLQLIRVIKNLSEKDLNEVINLTVKWLSRKNDWRVRATYLNLVLEQGTSEQKREAIIQTSNFLNEYPQYKSNISILYPLLTLIKRKGNSEAKNYIIPQALDILKKHPDFLQASFSFFLSYFLSILIDEGSIQQKQEVIFEIDKEIKNNPHIWHKVCLLPSYLQLIHEQGEPQKKQKVIQEVINLLENSSECWNDNKLLKIFFDMLKLYKNKKVLQQAISMINMWLEKNLDSENHQLVYKNYLHLIKVSGTKEQKEQSVRQVEIRLQKYDEGKKYGITAELLSNIAEIYKVLNSWNEAEKYYRLSYEEYKKIPDDKKRLHQLSYVLYNLSHILYNQGPEKRSDAIDSLRKSTELAKEIGNNKQIEINGKLMNKIQTREITVSRLL